ncbi:MAG: terminase family protein [candidate division Zixibacteria bacterium]|nr:terminase family protein [candidate division Zixibacteria bacterium]
MSKDSDITPDMKTSMCRASLAKELALCAQNFWYWAPNYVRTRDEENQSVRLFPKRQWDGDVRKSTYLSDIGDEIDDNQVTIILKSRRLLITWRILLRFMHKAQFAGSGIPDIPEAFTAAVLTVDEEAAKHLLAKVYAVYEKMPAILKEFNPIVIKNSLHCKFKLGGEIQGFSLKQSGQRSFGFSEILFDEAAFQMYARSTYEGARPTIGADGKMILVSTPNGKRNFFYKVWANEDGDFNNIHRIKLDWDVHPDRGEDWLEGIRGSMPEQGFNREYLCSFTTAAGKAVYKDEYDSVAHESDNKNFLAYRPDQPVLIGWDLGYWAPAVVLGQMNNKDQFVGQHEFFGFQEDIYAFAKRFRVMRASWYPQDATHIHIVPHDAFMSYRATSKQGHANDYQTLFAIPSTKAQIDPGVFTSEMAVKGKININERISSVRKLLRLRDDGRPGAVFSKKGCPDLIDGFKGGYAYPEEAKVKDGDKLQPEKGDYSHLHDALQEIATGYQGIIYMQKHKKKRGKTERSIASQSGYKIGM